MILRLSIEVSPCDRDNTEFPFYHGLYRFNRMPFGLKNKPESFEIYRGFIIATMKWRFDLVYFEDVFTFFNTPEEHIDQVRKVLTMFENTRVKIMLNKSFYWHNKIDYLGHVISPGSLELAPQ